MCANDNNFFAFNAALFKQFNAHKFDMVLTWIKVKITIAKINFDMPFMMMTYRAITQRSY